MVPSTISSPPSPAQSSKTSIRLTKTTWFFVFFEGFLSLILPLLAWRWLITDGTDAKLFAIALIMCWIVSIFATLKAFSLLGENSALRQTGGESVRLLKSAETRYRHILHQSPLGIVVFDTLTVITECNEVFGKVFGMSPQTAIGRDLTSFFVADGMRQAISDSLQKGKGFFEGDCTTVNPSRSIPIEITVQGIRDEDGTIIGGIGTLVDLSERRKFEKTLEHQASYDALTGLPNRHQLLQRLEQELSRGVRHKQHGALLFVDLDNFKTINDSLGHNAGDILLKQVAERLVSSLRKEDITARMGGDEFAILLPFLDESLDRAARKSQDVAKKVAITMASPFWLENHELSITPSFGISLFPETDKKAGDILQQADTAMNQAKKAGRNTARFFLPSMQQAADIRLRLNYDIRKAIENDELSVHFQPQVTSDGTIVGAEGLLRWTHPERGAISPGDFIPVAEESGIIVDIGTWVLRRICRTMREWQDAGLLTSNQTIAVNVSAREFAAPDFVDRVISTLRETGVHPQHLDIELTEGSLITSVTDTISKIKALRDYGIKFSVDDFGTGYSSLSYLKSLPLHTLKIDRSFVNAIRPVGQEVLLVEIIISMARNLGLEIVAEGVETAEELNYLAAKGCKVYQGYLFGRPVPSPDFRKLLESGGMPLKAPAATGRS